MPDFHCPVRLVILLPSIKKLALLNWVRIAKSALTLALSLRERGQEF
jgi:hypothetical protein